MKKAIIVLTAVFLVFCTACESKEENSTALKWTDSVEKITLYSEEETIDIVCESDNGKACINQAEKLLSDGFDASMLDGSYRISDMTKELKGEDFIVAFEFSEAQKLSAEYKNERFSYDNIKSFCISSDGMLTVYTDEDNDGLSLASVVFAEKESVASSLQTALKEE